MKLAPIPPPAALVADAIARIEERRDALDDLGRKGLAMIERIVAGEKVEIAGRKPFRDGAHAFAVVSRAVRLCLALASRLDEELIALLRGGSIPDLAILKPEPNLVPEAPVLETVGHSVAPTPRDRIARAVDTVIDAETIDRDAAERMRDYVQDHLIERETYDAFLHKPWRVVVEAICADLGLHPDWTAWDNAEGFKKIHPRVRCPSPLAGEGGPRSGSDEGSRPTINDHSRGDNPS